MTNLLPSQKKNMKMIMVFITIASCPWIALGGSHSRTQQQNLEKNAVNPVSKAGNFGKLLNQNLFQNVCGTVGMADGGSIAYITRASDGEERNATTESNWLKISTVLPNSVFLKAGESLELECEVLGSPPPNVKWLKDGKIFYPQEHEEIGNDVVQELFGGMIEDENDNLLGESEVLRGLTGGLAKVISRLRIPCVTPKHQGVYTCIATVPSASPLSNHLDEQENTIPQTVISSTIVHVRGRRVDVRTSACSKGGRFRAEGAWIQEWFPVVMQMMGKGIVLTCRAKGQPNPSVTWLDLSGKPVPFGNSIDSRHRVLPTGELYISELNWEDMGGYTCVVKNSVGKSSETTFLYPVRNEDQS